MAGTRDRLTRRGWFGTALGVAAPPLATALVAACGPSGAPAPQEGAPATVQFYFNGGTPEEQLYTTLKEGFEQRNPRYKLDLLLADNEIEKLLALMAAGTPPDVYWNRVRNSQVLIRRDALVDLLPLMKRDKLTQDDFWPSAVKAYTYKGGYFGLPTSASSNALYFNKIHFRQVGLPLPTELEKQGKWDWDALLETARKLTRTEANGRKLWGFLRPAGLTLNVMYMWENGGTPFSDDRTQCLVNSPECIAAEQFIADLGDQAPGRHAGQQPDGRGLPHERDGGYGAGRALPAAQRRAGHPVGRDRSGHGRGA
jgi:ABC-type glycerol-3-phosphate transport system substrate-binding protein